MREQSKVFKLSIGAMFVALTAIGANITSIVPFLVVGGVPITLQTFFAILSGLVLGSRLGAFTMFVYMMLGIGGAPVFAHFSGGASTVLSPTFGFIVSFILTAYVAGKVRELKSTLLTFVVASLLALLTNYIIGTNWMYVAYKLWFEAPEEFTYLIAWIWMVLPFIKDIGLTILVAILAYRLEKSGYTLNRHLQKKAVS